MAAPASMNEQPAAQTTSVVAAEAPLSLNPVLTGALPQLPPPQTAPPSSTHELSAPQSSPQSVQSADSVPAAATSSSSLSHTATENHAPPTINGASSVDVAQTIKHKDSADVTEALSDVQPGQPANTNNQPSLTTAEAAPQTVAVEQWQQPITPSTDASLSHTPSTATTLPLLPATPPSAASAAQLTATSSALTLTPVHPVVALLHDSAASFDQLYATISQHDANQQHYMNLVLPLSQRDMADKLHRIEMVSFELGMAQSNAMRVGRELDVMGGGMERVRQQLSSLMQAAEAGQVDEAANGSAENGKDVDANMQRESGKRKREDEEVNGQNVTVEHKVQRLASDAG